MQYSEALHDSHHWSLMYDVGPNNALSHAMHEMGSACSKDAAIQLPRRADGCRLELMFVADKAR